MGISIHEINHDRSILRLRRKIYSSKISWPKRKISSRKSRPFKSSGKFSRKKGMITLQLWVKDNRGLSWLSGLLIRLTTSQMSWRLRMIFQNKEKKLSSNRVLCISVWYVPLRPYMRTKCTGFKRSLILIHHNLKIFLKAFLNNHQWLIEFSLQRVLFGRMTASKTLEFNSLLTSSKL